MSPTTQQGPSSRRAPQEGPAPRPGPATLGTIEDAGQAAAALHPLRSRILDALREPASATAVARRFELPRQKVNYHVRELEKHGLVEAVEERRKGNCVERIVRATARSYLISPAALGGLAADPDTIRDRFSASYLMALAGRTVRDVGEVRQKAEAAGKRIATMALQSEVRFATAEDRSAFAEELTQAVAALIGKYHDEDAPDGRCFRLLLGAYPAVAADDGAGGAGGAGAASEASDGDTEEEVDR